MLTVIAEGVFVHEAEFVQSNSVVVRGNDGVLLIDPGPTRDELACIASDLDDLGLRVVAGFSTHPHWDHLPMVASPALRSQHRPQPSRGRWAEGFGR